VREYVLGGGIVPLFLWLGGLTAAALFLSILNIQWAWLIALAAAALVAALLHFLIDPLVASELGPPVTHLEALLKQIRTKSAASEAALEQFVCKHAGEHWEGVFEAVFGYDAKSKRASDGARSRNRWVRAGKGDRPAAAPEVRRVARRDYRVDRHAPARAPRGEGSAIPRAGRAREPEGARVSRDSGAEEGAWSCGVDRGQGG
jgi:hypothetical protein